MKINNTEADGTSKVDGARRRLMKISAVAGGTLAAASLLPGSWVKPLATIGGIPAHAQTSDTPIAISDLTLGAPVGGGDQGRLGSILYGAGFLYNDPLCAVSGATTLFVKDHYNTILWNNVPLSDAGITWSGDGCSGEVHFNFDAVDGCAGSVTVQLNHTGRPPSNSLTEDIICT